MKFQTGLKRARLIKRYKRFLCDIETEAGEFVTAHIADPGRLPGLAVPDAVLWYSTSDDKKRKLAHSVEMIEQDGSLVGVRPALANKLTREALEAGRFVEFQRISKIEPEFRLHAKSRLDFRLTLEDGRYHYIEVKSASWRRGANAAFPDAPTSRGTKHLRELLTLVEQDHLATILFVAQRRDVDGFEAADDIDPIYAKTLTEAIAGGVSLLACRCRINLNEIYVEDKIS